VAVENGRYTRWCFFLADGWRDYVTASVEDVCAFQYEAIHSAILAAKRTIPPDQWIEVFYEDIVNHPAQQIGAIAERLGLSFDGTLKAHTESLLDRPYEAMFEIRLDKWRDHAHRAKIERVLPRLRAVSEALGYDVPLEAVTGKRSRAARS
jgi:hypothetical protein